MKQIRMIVIMHFAMMIPFGIVISQSRPRPKSKTVQLIPASTATSSVTKRPVTINLKKGDPIKGYFLRADAETVQVEVKSGTLAIKLNEIDSLLFRSEEASEAKPHEAAQAEPPRPTQDSIQQNMRKAYTSLRKLSDAAKISLPYPQYANLLIEVRPVIEQTLSALPEGGVKSDVAAAMEAYMDAGQAWGAMLTKGVLPIATEPGATLMKKYAIKPAVNALGQEDHLQLDTTLNAIWTAAESRLSNLAMLLGK